MHKEGLPKSGLETLDAVRMRWIKEKQLLDKEIEAVPLQAQPEYSRIKRSFHNGRPKNRFQQFPVTWNANSERTNRSVSSCLLSPLWSIAPSLPSFLHSAP
jgi:hypothetical protein